MRGYITDSSAPGGLRLADDLPEPAPAPDELLLDVRAFAINRGETHLIEQRPDGFRPGQDVAGVVARTAADGSGPREGARVVASVEWEGWAERVAVPTHRAAALEDRVSFEQAATLPVAGLTALRALRVGGSVLGRDVLVTGATGGVGQFGVQLAVASGARVTAQVSRPEREGEARELGAHAVVVALDDDGLGPFHLVLDGVGGPLLAAAVNRMAPGATTVTYGATGGRAELGLFDFAQAANGKVMGLFGAIPEETTGEDLGILVGLIADGRLKPHIGSSAGWERANDALDALRNRELRGKAVLTR